MESESDTLSKYIISLPNFDYKNPSEFQYKNLGAVIIDGILQAGIHYNSVVKPRMEKFLKEYGNKTTLKDFKSICESRGVADLLNFKGVKGKRIFEVVSLLESNGINTVSEFREWLKRPDADKKLRSIKGIGDKTIDYFKILVGIPTVAIDTNIRKFLKRAGIEIRNGEYSKAKQIVESTARMLGVDPAVLDYSIWSYVSSGKFANG